MSRENENYRDVLENLKATFGSKTFITTKEIAAADGCCPRTARNRYRIPKGACGLDITILAKRKCQMAGRF